MTPQGGARRYRVALAGYYGFGNLGDELLAGASLEALEVHRRHRYQAKDIHCFQQDQLHLDICHLYQQHRHHQY